jgi:hypothetical protein
MKRSRYLGIAVLTGAFAISATAVAANESVRWTDTHEIDATYSCGVVEDTTATIEGTAFFDADGGWIKDVIRFSYDASYTDPVSGRTVSFQTRQIVEGSPETLTFRGQGVFVRAPGTGAVLLDVGRLVIDPSDGSAVFRSAKVLSFEDPSVAAAIDAAICSLF